MTEEPVDATTAAQPAPLPGDRGGERPPRTPRRARRSRAQLLIWGTALGAFAVFGVWLGSQRPGYVTHAEALHMATLIEGARTAEQLAPLFDLDGEVPGSILFPVGNEQFPPTTVGYVCRLKRTSSYTFVHTDRDEQGNRILLFRVHAGTRLLDYHELHLELRNGTPKVTNLWSMQHGADARSLIRMRDVLREALPFLVRARGDDDPDLMAEYERLPREVRSVPSVGSALLHHVAKNRPESLPRALEVVRAANPGHLAPDLVLLQEPVEPGPLRMDVRAAQRRIIKRVGDPDFLEQVWERITR